MPKSSCLSKSEDKRLARRIFFEFSGKHRWVQRIGIGRLKRVLVANRGEIALRIIRACRKLGLETVAVYSDADDNSPHVWAADRAVRIGPAPAAQSYLDQRIILQVALACDCDALHPGYGFLSERADFAAACAAEKINFIGPSAEAITKMGDKAEARRTAKRLGVPVVPGSDDAYNDASGATSCAADIGFPILLKALAGGGGRGMRVAADQESFSKLFSQASSEAQAAFGNGGIYLERFISRVRHIEVQVFGDQAGRMAHLWERDCSVQRRHQKLVEEGPSPVLDASTRRHICDAAVKLAEGIGYVGAGTVEFIYDPASSDFFFIEMNTRIQVEHPVTEMLTGVDLVAEQLRVAAGERLSLAKGSDVPLTGHAIEFRINAEDPARGFMPSPGTVTTWKPPQMPKVRFDSHVYRGYSVPRQYDSLLGKLIVYGTDRDDAIARSVQALDLFVVEGVATTIPFHLQLLKHRDFVKANVHTRWVETEFSHAEQ
jgi:acetyl-CoA carboxylase biotin carboxylase subunit